jgi:type II secretory pathway pseudopilin PulG
VKRKESGFTMMEMLIVLGILMLLVGLLIPALTAVKNVAKETKQKAQFATIELALAAFKNDHGDYPPSGLAGGVGDGRYGGAQRLSEALLGWDLQGFHPDSTWRSDGLDALGGPTSYDPLKSRDLNADGIPDTYAERKGPYLELGTANAFKLRDLFFGAATNQYEDVLAFDTYVICDAFTNKKVRLPDGKIKKAGLPILYYRANTSEQVIDRRYVAVDNMVLLQAKHDADGDSTRVQRPSLDPSNNNSFFYEYIRDPKIETRAWPYRPDSYLLISAGADGLYGTPDDIRNFGN